MDSPFCVPKSPHLVPQRSPDRAARFALAMPLTIPPKHPGVTRVQPERLADPQPGDGRSADSC
eukprot:1941722-Pyramimonas_sp.AAC.1